MFVLKVLMDRYLSFPYVHSIFTLTHLQMTLPRRPLPVARCLPPLTVHTNKLTYVILLTCYQTAPTSWVNALSFNSHVALTTALATSTVQSSVLLHALAAPFIA